MKSLKKSELKKESSGYELSKELLIDPTNIDREIEESAAHLFYHGQIIAFKEKEVAIAELTYKTNKEQMFLDYKKLKGDEKLTEKEIEATYRTNPEMIELAEDIIEKRFQLTLVLKKYEALMSKDHNVRAIYSRRVGGKE
jgi:glycerol-3-phosphate dehydrogenase